MPIVKWTHRNQTIQARFYPIQNSLKTVIILTGMEEHSLRYEPLAQYLNQLHCSVYVFDHIGQGLNAPTQDELGIWPTGTFEWTADALGHFIQTHINQSSVYFIGHSLGSFVGQRLIQKFDQFLAGVVLIGTNHQDPMAPIGRLLTSWLTHPRNRNHKAPFFNQLAFGQYASKIKPRKTPFDWLSVNPTNVTTYMKDPYCGYVSTYGFWHELLHALHHLFDAQRLLPLRKDLPVLILSGKEDPVGHFGKGPEKVASMYRRNGFMNVNVILYPGLRHEILNEDSSMRVFEDIQTFILAQ